MSAKAGKGAAQHGTWSSYNRAGCRCEACRRAASDYMRRRRLRSAMPEEEPGRLGRSAIAKALEDRAVLYMGAGRGLVEVPMPEISAAGARGLESLLDRCA